MGGEGCGCDAVRSVAVAVAVACGAVKAVAVTVMCGTVKAVAETLTCGTVRVVAVTVTCGTVRAVTVTCGGSDSLRGRKPPPLAYSSKAFSGKPKWQSRLRSFSRQERKGRVPLSVS